MRPGIIVKHNRTEERGRDVVRCDIAAFLGFVRQDRWPDGAHEGDFVEIEARRPDDLWHHPQRELLDPATVRAVRAFFDNGGRRAHVFGVCVREGVDLGTASAVDAVFGPVLDHLRANDDIALVAAPGAAYMRYDIARDGAVRADVEPLYDALLAHCREMTNRFLVMDAPRGLHGPHLVRWVKGFRGSRREDRSFGAIYYPWVAAGSESMPPSGTVVGLYARSEVEHGLFGVAWPPANQTLRGITHPEVDLAWSESGELLQHHINPIVVQPGHGVVVFGARTLSPDPRYVHINSRRVVNLVSEQLCRDSEWAVFETHNPHLWDALERDVRVRLSQFSAAGLLGVAGGPSSEFRVRCDSSLNTPAVRERGQVRVEVLLRPVGTTEQITIDLNVGARAAGGA